MAGTDGRSWDLFRGTVAGVVAEFLGVTAGFVSSLYLVRVLGPDRYGVLSVIFGCIAMPAWLAGTVFSGRAAIFAVAAGARRMDQILCWSRYCGVLCTLIFMSISPFLARLLGVERDATLLAVAGIEILLLSTAFTQRDILIGLGSYNARPRGALIFHSLRLLFILVLAGFGVLGVITAVMCARLAEVSYYRFHLVRAGAEGSAILARPGGSRLFTAHAVHTVCQQILNSGPLIVLALSGTWTSDLGRFAAAANIAMVPGLFGTVISNNMISAMVRKPADQVDIAEIWTRVTLMLAVLIAPLAASGTCIVALLFGANFAEAGLQFSWLALGAAGFLIFHAQMGQLMIRRAPLLAQLATVPVAGLAIAAYSIGAKAAGPTGVAVGQALVGLTAASFSLICLFKESSATSRSFVLLSNCVIAAIAGVVTVKAVEGYAAAPVDLFAGLLVSIGGLWISQVVGGDDVKFALRSLGLAR